MRRTSRPAGGIAICELRLSELSNGLVWRNGRDCIHAMRSSCESDLVKRHPLHIAARWLGNTPRIAEKHYLITSNADFDEASGMEREAKAEGGAESGAVDVQKVISEPESVQKAVQHDPATDRTKQNPAGTYTKSCGVTRADSDSQGGEGGTLQIYCSS